MELHLTAGIGIPAEQACRRYLDRLPLSRERKQALLEAVKGEADPRRAMARLHAALAGVPAAEGEGSGASLGARLQLAYPSLAAEGAWSVDPAHPWHLATTPPPRRTPMAAAAWPPSLPVRLLRRVLAWLGASRLPRAQEQASSRPAPRGPADGSAGVRRWLLAALVLGQTATGASAMAAVLPYRGSQPLEIAILVLFTILFGWVSVGFWTAVMGCWVLLIGGDRRAITRSASRSTPIPSDARTAIVMPICNEHVTRVFAGLRATYESLASTGALERFDLFVLSDSSEPDTRAAETKAWLDLCEAVGGFGRVFYRWRRHRIKRKSGNVADFCRRWGSRYRYMVVLDADSVMSGECLTALVRLMEANPTTGIIQTAPLAAGRDTLYARVQQFATRVYGPVFTAGLHFWQLGESYYWGHNAIIRIAPFMRHCGLGRLSGRGPLSGEILSHDFVEAALMRRAGWKVWIAYDLPGSYEEMPPNLLDELKRDRRWCQGNLINARLFLAEGLHPAHRAVFMTGAMAYLSAPLWLLSLALSTGLIAVQTLIGPTYFVQPRQLFPVWPAWDPEWAVGLAAATALVLFLPKILAAVLVAGRGARRFGGAAHLALSLLLEMVFSALLAPVRMLFHTQFVVAALTGWRIHWNSPPREDAQTTWGEAVRRHGPHTLLGLLWAGGVYWLAPSFFWWLLPVVGPLALSIPISVWSSRVSLGRWLRGAKLFLIPEESRPPRELRAMSHHLERGPHPLGFVDAVVEPLGNAIAVAAGPARPGLSPARQAAGAEAMGAALQGGPAGLTDRQKMLLLDDPDSLSLLHFQVWTASEAHPGWLVPSRLAPPAPALDVETSMAA